MYFKKYANEKGINFSGTWDSAFRNLISENFLNGSYSFCAAVEGKSLEFNVDGSIKICSHTTTQAGHIDNFDQVFQKTGSLYKIVENRFPGTEKYCTGCDIEGLCSGQCHVTREAAERLCAKERQKLLANMCNFYRMVTKLLIVEYIQLKNMVKNH